MATEYTGYFDDSGKRDTEAGVLVAGSVATVDQWAMLETQWRETLRNSGVASGVFHMTDFEAGWGDYAGWDDTRKRILLDKLISHIVTRTRKWFCAVVAMNDYREVNEHFTFEECHGKPFAIAGSGGPILA